MKKINESGEDLKAKIHARIAELNAELRAFRNHLEDLELIEKNVIGLLGASKAVSASDKLPRQEQVAQIGSYVTVGMTEAVKAILRGSNGVPMSAPQIRDALIEGGFKGGKNIYVILTTTLKRLSSKQGIIVEQTVDGKKCYTATKDLL